MNPKQSPLKINKDSHLIRKSLSSTSSYIRGVATATAAAITNTTTGKRQQQQQQQQQQQIHRKPVIIYTHSPKVIHTTASEFKSLVQRLTGFNPPENHSVKPQSEKKNNGKSSSSENNKNMNKNYYSCPLSSAAAATDHENTESVFKHPNPSFSDIPFFPSPPPTDFCCPPNWSLYK